MSIPENFYRTSIKALILDETKEKFLLVLDKAGSWELPGGGLNRNELPDECLRREIKEEMSLEVESMSDDISYFIPALSDDGRFGIVQAIYETTLKSFDFIPSDECVEIRFFTPAEVSSVDSLINTKKFAQQFNPAKHK